MSLATRDAERRLDGVEFARDSGLGRQREPTHGVRKRDRDRAARIKLEGGKKATLRERALALVCRNGEVRTKDFTDIGIPRCYLSRMCEEGLLKKAGFGRYQAANLIAAAAADIP